MSAGPVPRGSGLLLVAQAAIAAALVACLAFTPPRAGPMMVVPLSSSPVKPWLDDQNGVTVLGVGRIAGSIVVAADRNRLLSVAVLHGAILIPALPALCASPVR